MIILQQEFKFKFLNLNKRYGNMPNMFGHVANYRTMMHLQGATDRASTEFSP